MLKSIIYRWLLIAILLGMQYVALHHAVEHLFHQTDISCSIFATVEHQSNGLIQDIFDFKFIFNNQIVIYFQDFLFEVLFYSSFQARAPPFLALLKI